MTEPTPVLFIHGLWLHASSWQPWVDLFTDAGYAPVAPGWPGEPDSVVEANAHPELVANVGIADAAEHFASIAAGLPSKPILIGHSFGGLLTEKLLGEDVGIAGVAIDPAQIKGVLPLPLAQIRAGLPGLGNPTNRHKAVALTFEQFRYGFGNALSEDEAKELYDQYHVAGSGVPVFQAAFANINPRSETKADNKNPDRGPMLLIGGELDHQAPWAITEASYKRQKKNSSVTEIVEIAGRGHSLTIDHGWQEVAKTALDFIKRFVT
jgi:non-heme chloroperoxidase